MTIKITCPHCGKSVDGIGLIDQGKAAPPQLPVDGDFAFCSACGQWACWVDKKLRKPTDEEHEILFSDWDAIKVMVAWVFAMRDRLDGVTKH